MVKPPCERDCPRRTVGCHTKCAPYLEYEEAKQADIEREKLNGAATPTLRTRRSGVRAWSG